MSAPHFSVQRLARLDAKAIHSALTWLGFDAKRDPTPIGGGDWLARGVLFSCMIERSLPIPLDLLGLRSVLLIDDEPAVLRSLARLLRQAVPDLTLLLADGARDGLAQAAERKPDSVLVDAYMPELGGVEVCARIHSANRKIPILAMTADPSPELAEAFARAGAVAILEKPVGAPALFEVLSAHLVPSSAGDW